MERETEAFQDSMTMYDDLERKYDYATKERFGFLFMNLATGKAYRNFEEEL